LSALARRAGRGALRPARGRPGEMCGRGRALERRGACWRGEAKQDRRIGGRTPWRMLAGRGKTGSANCERRGGSAVGEAGSPERRRRARSTSGRRRRRRRRSRPLNRRRSASRAPVGRISFCERGASNRQKIHKCDHRNHRIAWVIRWCVHHVCLNI